MKRDKIDNIRILKLYIILFFFATKRTQKNKKCTKNKKSAPKVHQNYFQNKKTLITQCFSPAGDGNRTKKNHHTQGGFYHTFMIKSRFFQKMRDLKIKQLLKKSLKVHQKVHQDFY